MLSTSFCAARPSRTSASLFVPCRKCAGCSSREAGGLIIDLRHDAPAELIDAHVNAMGLTAVNRVVTKLTFRLMLLKNAYTRDQFQHMLAQAGFRSFDIREVDIGFEISMTK
jgi:hypothetical protein